MESENYPSIDALLSKTLKFFHKGNDGAASFFRLGNDGSFVGYSHVNEATWDFFDGKLRFFSQAGEVSVVFDDAGSSADRVMLEGRHLLEPNQHVILSLQSAYDAVNIKNPNETREIFKDQITHMGWSVGRHTYGHPLVYSTGHQKLEIGSYTAIGHSVTIALAYHRPDFSSIFPFVIYKNLWPNVPNDVSDHRSKGGVKIGSDVWIGHGAFIGDGVTIGDGAVIGAQSVVTKDVPPYAIFAGNPARFIRERFSPEVINRLLDLKWWLWPDEKVNYFIPLILSDDVEKFLAKASIHP